MTKRTGRPRTGSLYLAKSGWRARVTVEVDGVNVQRSFDLGTKSKGAARVKLRRLLEAEAPTVEQAKRVETFREAALRIVDASKIASKANRLGRLRNPRVRPPGSEAGRPSDDERRS